MFSDFVEINQDLENIYIFEREDDDTEIIILEKIILHLILK
jgi:hypothetical protein